MLHCGLIIQKTPYLFYLSGMLSLLLKKPPVDMDFLTIFAGLLVSLILIKSLIKSLSGRSVKLPPGPRPLPIIGNLHLLGKQPHESLSQLSKTYGPVMLLRLGFKDTVVISSAAMAKEVLQKQDLAFSSRTIPNATHAHDHFKYSVVWLPVQSRWRSLRKIMNTNIFSVSSLDVNQHLRHQKVKELIEYCRQSSHRGEAVDISQAAFRTTLNLLSNTIFSKDLADPFSDSAKEFNYLVREIMAELGKPNLVDFFPFLGKLDVQGILRRATIYYGEIIDIFKSLIDERIEKGNIYNGEKIDMVDELLAISKESQEEMDMTHIEKMCLDLFVAGTDTTTITLEWAMAEALRNPEAVKKAKVELAEVVGKGKVLDDADVARLPYLRCMVKETMRLHPAVPFLLPHKVDQDVNLCGYTVPKDSQVFVNAWAIGRDADTWADPLKFKPERFLDSEVDLRGRDFELIPFGAGRRMCPGMPLAVRMVSAMLGSLLNSFEWELEGGIKPEELDMGETFGITMRKAHPLRAIPIQL